MIRIVEIHGVEGDDSYLVGYYLDRVIGPSLEDLEVVKGYEGLPYPANDEVSQDMLV